MISKKQKLVYDFIVSFTSEHGYAPSLKEIADNFDEFMSHPSSAHYHVKRLQEEGYLERESHKPRSLDAYPIKTLDSPSLGGGGKSLNFIQIPILGAANCGPAAIFADEYVEGYLKVSKKMVPQSEDLFILRAEGDSMNKAEVRGKPIHDGDFVLVDSSKKTPQSGDYVVAVVDGMGTIKKFIRDPQGKRIMLLAESTTDYLPIFIHQDDLEDLVIAGTVVDVIKNPYAK